MQKWLLFIILLFVSTISYSQTYEYVPFPTKNAVWGTYFHSNPNFGFESLTVCSSIEIKGDTMMRNGKIYYKTNMGVGIREDSLKRIYVIDWSDERLRYDFSLNIGDTTIINGEFANFKGKVDSIDYVEVMGKLRKRFKVSHYSNNFGQNYYLIGYEYWLEGFGSCNYNGTILESGLDLIDNSVGTYCLRQDGILTYKNPFVRSDTCKSGNGFVSGCDTYIGLDNEVSNKIHPISISPNPIQNNSQLLLSEEFEGETLSMKIYNSFGGVVRNGISELSLTDLPSGIYYYTIENKGKFYKGNFIVN